MEKEKGLTNTQIKTVALFFMLIDHIGVSVVSEFIKVDGSAEGLIAYYICRLFGRVAFPLFCFLITEGIVHTHSLGKYAMRMWLFAIISEVPFDLMGEGVLFFFTGAECVLDFCALFNSSCSGTEMEPINMAICTGSSHSSMDFENRLWMGRNTALVSDDVRETRHSTSWRSDTDYRCICQTVSGSDDWSGYGSHSVCVFGIHSAPVQW